MNDVARILTALLTGSALLALTAESRAGLATVFAHSDSTTTNTSAEAGPSAPIDDDPFSAGPQSVEDRTILPAGFTEGILHGETACPRDRFLAKSNCGAGADPSGFTYSWKPDRWAKVGAGIRASFNAKSSRNPGIGGNYFTINNARLLTSGQITDNIGFELNSDVGLANGPSPSTVALPSSYNLLDAIVKIETGDLFNVWMGQFLPPSDRSNIDGPFYINGWDFPFVSNYPAVFQGRQIGAAYWGQLGGGRIKWSMGAFNGFGATVQSPYTNPPDAPPNPANNISFDTRVTINFLDPEPGYYHQSTYYGKKEILALGFALQTQHNASGTARDPASFTGINMDLLYETKLANNGVVTFEGALYHFNDQDLITSSRQGQSGFLYAAYMFPRVISVAKIDGRLRPYVRYQKYNRDFIAPSVGLYSQGVDVGTEYVINGANARLTAAWGNRDVIGDERLQEFKIGAQVIF